MNPFPVFVATLLALAPAARAADPPGLIGDFGAWTAYVQTGGQGGRQCYVASRPVRTTAARLRGDAYILVADRPGEAVFGEFSAVTGYDLDEALPSVRVGSENFELIARGDTAWVRAADQPRLVAAMRRADELSIVGQSGAGVKTVETYALRGFVPAYAAIGAACGRG